MSNKIYIREKLFSPDQLFHEQYQPRRDLQWSIYHGEEVG